MLHAAATCGALWQQFAVCDRTSAAALLGGRAVEGVCQDHYIDWKLHEGRWSVYLPCTRSSSDATAMTTW
jgi:hypothetical protein